jgi:Domain of unknown function (DUF5076)
MSDHHHHNHHGEMHPHQLEPPHEVFHDPHAGELVRAWLTKDNLSLALRTGAFSKVDIWGHVLAGIAQNVAAACAEQGMGTMSANLETIRKTLADDLGKAAAQASVLANKG